MKRLGRIAVALSALALVVAPAAVFAEGEHGEQGATHEAGSAPKTAGELEAHGEGHAAAEGHGEGHAAPSLDVKRLGFQLLNFAVLVFLLVKFGGPAVNKALARAAVAAVLRVVHATDATARAGNNG